MFAADRFHRSDDGVLAGVCAGIADHFDIDAVLVRVLAVLIVILTFGLGAIAYLALALSWSKEGRVKPIDIDPRDVDSTAFGNVDAKTMRRHSADSMRSVAEMPLCVGHQPPTPPRGYVVPGEGSRPAAAVGARMGAGAFSPGLVSSRPSYDTLQMRAKRNSTVVSIMIVFALGVITLALCAFANAFIEPIGYDACWPMFFVLVGTVIAVIPREFGTTSWRLSAGAALVVLGVLFLSMSTDILSWSTLTQPPGLLPILIVTLVAAVVAYGLTRIRWAIIANIVVIALCVVALAFFAVSGSVDSLTFVLPNIQPVTLYTGPWTAA